MAHEALGIEDDFTVWIPKTTRPRPLCLGGLRALSLGLDCVKYALAFFETVPQVDREVRNALVEIFKWVNEDTVPLLGGEPRRMCPKSERRLWARAELSTTGRTKGGRQNN